MKEVIVTSLLLLALPIFGCSGLTQAAPIVAATSTFTAVPTLIETGTLPIPLETEISDTNLPLSGTESLLCQVRSRGMGMLKVMSSPS